MAAELIMIFIFSCHILPSSAKNPALHSDGVHLRVAAIDEPPMVIVGRDASNASHIVYSGIAIEIFDIISQHLNFTYSFVLVPNDVVYSKGRTGWFADYLQDKADIISLPISHTPRAAQVVEFSTPVTVSGMRLLQPMPKMQSRLFAMVKPLEPTVWLFVTLFMLAVPLSLNFILWVAAHYDQIIPSDLIRLDRHMIYALSMVLGQENYYSSRVAMLIVAGTWSLAGIVLINAYKGMLMSDIALPKYQPIVNSFDELAHSQHLKLVVSKGSRVFDWCMNAETGPFRLLGDSLRQNPHRIFSTRNEMMDFLLSGNYVYPMVTDMAHQYVYVAYKTFGECRLTVSKSIGYFETLSFGLAKHGTQNRAINKQLQYLWENGLLDRIKKSYFKQANKCSERRVYRSRLSRLNLTDLSSAFLILIFGLSIALLTFLLEMIFRPRSRRNEVSPPVEGPRELLPPSWVEIHDLEAELDDKRRVNQVITLNIIAEQPLDEDRNVQQQQVIIRQTMTSRGHKRPHDDEDTQNSGHYQKIKVRSRHRNGEQIQVEVIIHQSPPE